VLLSGRAGADWTGSARSG